MRDTATYIYCVVHAARAPKPSRLPAGLPGATRPSIGGVARSLWLVSAEVPLDVYGAQPLEAAIRSIEWVGKIAVAHEAVVEHLARQPDGTVIPMKLFTMFSSEERAIDDLRSEQGALRAIARRIAGCEEWGIRMAASSRPVTVARSLVQHATSGAAFLSAKKHVRDSARHATLALSQTADDTFTALSRIARDARRRDDAPDGAPPPLLDAAFLVPATQRTRFKAASRRLARAATQHGAEITLSGPWPAYNFIQSPGS